MMAEASALFDEESHSRDEFVDCDLSSPTKASAASTTSLTTPPIRARHQATTTATIVGNGNGNTITTTTPNRRSNGAKNGNGVRRHGYSTNHHKNGNGDHGSSTVGGYNKRNGKHKSSSSSSFVVEKQKYQKRFSNWQLRLLLLPKMVLQLLSGVGLIMVLLLLWLGWEELHDAVHIIKSTHRKHHPGSLERHLSDQFDERHRLAEEAIAAAAAASGGGKTAIRGGGSNNNNNNNNNSNSHRVDKSATQQQHSIDAAMAAAASAATAPDPLSPQVQSRLVEMLAAYTKHTLLTKGGGSTDHPLDDKTLRKHVQRDAVTFLQDTADSTTMKHMVHEAFLEQENMLKSEVELQEEHERHTQDEEEDDYDNQADDDPDAPDLTIDRHIRNLELVEERCMGDDKIALDVNDADFSIDNAIWIMRNCKLLVLRNALDRDWVQQTLKPRLSGYIGGLQANTIDHEGVTTNAESYFFAGRDYNRWEVLLPQAIVHDTKEELLENERFVKIFQDDSILGDHLSLMSAGLNFAAPGANGQDWHEDDQFVFGASSLPSLGLAGHDVPATAITLSIPLLDVHAEHGPTEFCMGSSTLMGTDVFDYRFGDPNGTEEQEEYVNQFVRDKSLAKPGSAFQRFASHGYDGCHPDFWQSPQLRMGDVLFFDYQLKHRGGWNTSPTDSRAIMFLTYARYWFKDSNFHQNGPPQVRIPKKKKKKTTKRKDIDDGEVVDYWNEDDEWELVRAARFALPHGDYLDKHTHDSNHDVALTDVGPLLEDLWEVEQEEDHEQEHNFLVSNKNVKSGTHTVALFVDEEHQGTLKAGQSMEVQVQWGQTISLQTKRKKLFSWGPIHGSQRGQIMFHKDMTPAVSV